MSSQLAQDVQPQLSPKEDTSTELDDQNARAKLRTRFLRSIQSVYNLPANFHLHERTDVSAVFRGTDINVESFAVSDLQTPIGPIAEAMLRASDVISFTVNVKDVN